MSSKRKAEDISKENEDEHPVDEGKKEDVVHVAEEVAAAAAAAAEDTDAPSMVVDVDGSEKDNDGDKDDGDDDDKDDGGDKDNSETTGSASKRRFFPRVKHLLSSEWEPFLAGVLNALEETGAPQAAAASQNPSNAWYKAFDQVYTGVARDCSVPHGKNRYHKFKDKIIEMWQALENYAGDDIPLQDKAVAQLEEYRKACTLKATTPRKDFGGWPIPKALAAPIPNKTPSRGGRASTPTPTSTKNEADRGQKWEHLDEAAALQKLPVRLRNLVNIRHLGIELYAGNRLAVDDQYDKALQAYLKDIPDCPDAMYEMILGLAFLRRCSQSTQESREIMEVYDRVVVNYLIACSTASSSSAERI